MPNVSTTKAVVGQLLISNSNQNLLPIFLLDSYDLLQPLRDIYQNPDSHIFPKTVPRCICSYIFNYPNLRTTSVATSSTSLSINKETKVLNNNVLIEKICSAGRFYIIFILIDRPNSIIVEASPFSFNHPMGHTLHFHSLFNDTKVEEFVSKPGYSDQAMKAFKIEKSLRIIFRLQGPTKYEHV